VRRVGRDYPAAGRAAEWLAQRRIVTPDVAARVGDHLTWDAFRVGDADNETLVRRVRDLLVQQVVEGPDPRGFKARAKAILKDDATKSEIEATFRTQIRRSYAEAQRQLTDNPVVRAVLPYRLYFATHDGRTRPEHRALETLGLDGTNVYRTDDPMWDYFEPPWDYNCRCEAPYVTIERAAELGVREAQEWLVGIDPPETPEWRIDDIPFRPKHVLLV
jgi:SPP1 gp7 family putative phage head morphogenesis protein